MRRESGFILHASYDTSGDGTRIYLVGRTLSGLTFAAIFRDVRPGFYVRASDRESLDLPNAQVEHTEMSTIDGEEVLRLRFDTVQHSEFASQRLIDRGIRTYESDLRVYDAFLIEHQIYGMVSIVGEPTPGRHVDMVYVEPRIEPVRDAEAEIPVLVVCALDIENDPVTREILSISIAATTSGNGDSANESSEVLFSGSDPRVDDVPWIRRFDGESDLLLAFKEQILRLDPDILTGWNVIEYDFELIAERFAHHKIAFDLGRSDRLATYLHGTGAQSGAVIIPGRQVIDAMRVMRSSPTRFFDNKLDTVAKEILGEGKIELEAPSIDGILRSYRDDPVTFCGYNRRDSELVLAILRESGMLDLTIRRSILTGLPVSRAWTSVAAFEQIYIGRMHNEGLVAPTHGVDAHRVGRAPGGAIIPPRPGLYDNVLVFDFKSLYPTIMRTFNIDPAAYLPPERVGDFEGDHGVIEAPNGATFRRDRTLLPDILAELFARRDAAKEARNEEASFVYKIIMNSFYGVLGTPGCRFAASDIAGGITSFGHEFLSWSRRHFESLGFKVLYGDTDSLFALPPDPKTDSDTLRERGASLAAAATDSLTSHIRKKWDLPSYLVLEFEHLYRRFFLPALRGVGSGSKLREVEVAALQGRAKGYAGLRHADGAIQIKGLEAVRRDWTDAAKDLQRYLLQLIFDNTDPEAVESEVGIYIDSLMAGKLDEQLIYHKALRKSIESYTRNKPPHVRAAMLLSPEDRGGVIDYIWTTEGPEPAKRAKNRIDHRHYVEKQIRPIVEGIGDVIGHSFARVFGDDGQRELF